MKNVADTDAAARTVPGAVLFTQCLQNDFVKPIGRYDTTPNDLHIGAAEARRLMGDDPREGAMARMMEWAYGRSPEELTIVNILDWHSPDDPEQAAHLQQFKNHCLAGTAGAEPVLPVPDSPRTKPVEIHSTTLNDFQGTDLADALAQFAHRGTRAGIVGVWTEAKVFFLAYELRTRYPDMQIAVCSALTASSSRTQHFMALDQLRRMLGVHVYNSVGDFMEFLGGEAEEYPLTGLDQSYPRVDIEKGEPLSEEDNRLLRYLFRDCRNVTAAVLDGGYSGNVVLGTRSTDLHGHEQVNHVIKIGDRALIARERTSFERIENVLGNNAPRITDFADLGDRGAVKYRYASMGGGQATTFQKAYMDGMPMDEVATVLTTVFEEELGRLYAAAKLESRDLLDYYEYAPKWAPSVRGKVEAIIGGPADGDTLRLPCGPAFPNICHFYEHGLEAINRRRSDVSYFSYVHGDLNGANIILDAHRNVWLIDFFHTHEGHVLRDLVKLENDLLYIFTPVPNSATLEEAMRFSELLLSVDDLAAPVPPASRHRLERPQFLRAYETLRILRGFYPGLLRADRSVLQWRIAAMRYAVHTLSFDECSDLQKQWALYTASLLGDRILKSIAAQKPLRLDALDRAHTTPGTLSITILPGRRDYSRDITEDLSILTREGVTDILCLVPSDELAHYGVPDLLDQYRQLNIAVRHLPIRDQRVCTQNEMREAVAWLHERLHDHAHILVHCTGGLGRSGTAAACYLKTVGLSSNAAIAEVRRARSSRAVETELQRRFIEEFSA